MGHYLFSNLFSSSLLAVQHERKPLLDKKEAAAAAAAAAIVANNSSTGDIGSTFSSQNRNSVSGLTKSFQRNDFIGSPSSNNIPNLNSIFPVNLSFAELTSTLAQRGSKLFSPFSNLFERILRFSIDFSFAKFVSRAIQCIVRIEYRKFGKSAQQRSRNGRIVHGQHHRFDEPIVQYVAINILGCIEHSAECNR